MKNNSNALNLGENAALNLNKNTLSNSNLTNSNSALNEASLSKLAHSPIMLFASVMGLGGLALVFKKASAAFAFSVKDSLNFLDLNAVFAACSLVFGFLSIAVFLLLLGFYVAKIFTHFNAFKAEITHQVKINFLSAIPIGALIITTFLGAFNDNGTMLFLLKIIFYLSSFLQLILSIYVINFWFSNAMKKHLLSPAWFIPIVGNLIVPLAGHSAKISPEFSLFFFSVGCFFWLILTALITSRLIFEESLESKFLPTLFIFIAPPSIFVVDFAALFGGHSALSLMLYFVALFFMLLMLSLSKVFTHLNFALSWWAFTFPLCAFGIASFETFMVFKSPLYMIFGILGLILALFAVLFVSYKTLLAMSKGKICVPEKA